LRAKEKRSGRIFSQSSHDKSGRVDGFRKVTGERQGSAGDLGCEQLAQQQTGGEAASPKPAQKKEPGMNRRGWIGSKSIAVAQPNIGSEIVVSDWRGPRERYAIRHLGSERHAARQFFWVEARERRSKSRKHLREILEIVLMANHGWLQRALCVTAKFISCTGQGGARLRER